MNRPIFAKPKQLYSNYRRGAEVCRASGAFIGPNSTFTSMTGNKIIVNGGDLMIITLMAHVLLIH
ncbi:hypothetical protein AGMMS49921_05940 [Endomicrobiia bacterium]|nr:hypothetical protein AGMMS49921_05940 [Endomicrobiia bacterium]